MGDENRRETVELPLMEILAAVNEVSTNVALNTQAITNLNDNLSKEIDAKILKLESKYAKVLIGGLFVLCISLWKVVIPWAVEEGFEKLLKAGNLARIEQTLKRGEL